MGSNPGLRLSPYRLLHSLYRPLLAKETRLLRQDSLSRAHAGRSRSPGCGSQWRPSAPRPSRRRPHGGRSADPQLSGAAPPRGGSAGPRSCAPAPCGGDPRAGVCGAGLRGERRVKGGKKGEGRTFLQVGAENERLPGAVRAHGPCARRWSGASRSRK